MCHPPKPTLTLIKPIKKVRFSFDVCKKELCKKELCKKELCKKELCKKELCKKTTTFY